MVTKYGGPVGAGVQARLEEPAPVGSGIAADVLSSNLILTREKEKDFTMLKPVSIILPPEYTTRLGFSQDITRSITLVEFWSEAGSVVLYTCTRRYNVHIQSDYSDSII